MKFNKRIITAATTAIVPVVAVWSGETTTSFVASMPNEVIKDYALISVLLSNVSDRLHDVHTAEYDFTRSQFETPDDEFCVQSDRYHVLECENPADTNGNAKFVYLNPKSGIFEQGYDGKNTYYNRRGEVERSVPMSTHGSVIVNPPFFQPRNFSR